MDVETMRYYYQNGLWDKARLDKLLAAGKITAAELEEVTAEAQWRGEVNGKPDVIVGVAK